MVLDPFIPLNDDSWSYSDDQPSYSTDEIGDWSSPDHNQPEHDLSYSWNQYHQDIDDDSFPALDQLHDQGYDRSWYSSSDQTPSSMVSNDDHCGGYFIHQNFDPNDPQGIVIGDPGDDMNSWHLQQHPNDSAIVTQQSILETLSGQHFSENTLCTEAQLDGYYDPAVGTPLEHIGDLLENRGISLDRHYGATLADLNDKLAHGEKVVVAVNSAELWRPDRDSMMSQTLNSYPGIPGQPANHTVVVTGIVYSTSDTLVVVNDLSIPNGAGMMVPLEQFEQAWEASDYYMVSTDLNGVTGDSIITPSLEPDDPEYGVMQSPPQTLKGHSLSNLSPSSLQINTNPNSSPNSPPQILNNSSPSPISPPTVQTTTCFNSPETGIMRDNSDNSNDDPES